MKISELPVDFSVVWNGNFIIDNPENIQGKNKEMLLSACAGKQDKEIIFSLSLSLYIQIFFESKVQDSVSIYLHMVTTLIS